ncbi:MAG: DNA-directed RNA polymerase subunit beta', partial [bacterium]|nr:DNA-directed RNA polymerase subunit beta' [bacterium]
LAEVVPAAIGFDAINRVMDKKAVAELIDQCYRLCADKETVLLADNLRRLGFTYSTKAGISICIDDMAIPTAKKELLDRAYKEVRDVEEQYTEGLITAGEKYNKVVDIWAEATEAIADIMMDGLEREVAVSESGEKREQLSFNPIFIMADSGARGSAQQMRQLAGMRGLMAKPSGEIIETPITANFREGLNVLQYFISTHGARKGLADTALKTANSGYLTRRLVDVAQDSVVLDPDCGTLDGIEMEALLEGGEVIVGLGDRILGRVILEDVVDPFSGALLIAGGEEVTEEGVQKVEDAGVEKVRIRSVLTCRNRKGICIKCYGRDLARGHLVSIGEAVGVIAAQAIGEPGTQLTMRTFHIGGTASRRVEQSTLESRHEGTIKLHNEKTVVNKEGKQIVMNRNAEIAIADDEGRERERYRLTYGAVLKVKVGQKVKPGTQLAEWDPYATPILTEVTGQVRYAELVEGISLREQVDEVTGLATKVVTTPKKADYRPRITIKDSKGETAKLPDGKSEARYLLPV